MSAAVQVAQDNPYNLDISTSNPKKEIIRNISDYLFIGPMVIDLCNNQNKN
jgi:hypothetical protein